jgi:hypothetical protein
MLFLKNCYQIFTFIILSLFVYSATAQFTVYNNFGEGHDGWDYNYGLGWTISGDSVEAQYGVEQAMGFQSEEDGALTDIWLAISRVPMSSPADTVIIRFAENPDGLPPQSANVLEEWMLTGFASWSQWNTPFHLEGNGTTLLEEGHSYWIWAIGYDETWTMWCMNENAGLTCPHTIRREGEDWLSISDETASAFRVDIALDVNIYDPRENSVEGSSLSQNYPNPFSNATRISYIVLNPALVNLKIYDTYGRERETLVSEFKDAGTYTIDYNASGLTKGLYFYTLQIGDQLVESKKMSCLR